MARTTKAELENVIKVKDNLINTLIKRNIELENKLSKFNNKLDNEFCNSVIYVQMDKEIKYLKDIIKAQEISIQAKEDTIKHKINVIQELLNNMEK